VPNLRIADGTGKHGIEAAMSNELTEAERAAFAEMLRHTPHESECWCGDNPCDECSATARAVVAAVRPIIEAGALRDLAETLDKLPAAYGTDPEYRSGIADAVGIARARADRRDNP
jgi:hypothetical protein